MKYIWLGIKDYCKDCWHDFIRKEAGNRYGWNMREAVDYYKSGRVKYYGIPVWKEGSVWHYIQQRKLSYKTQNTRDWVLEEYIKTKQDFIYYVWAALDEIASNGATYEWFVDECNYLCKIAEKRGWLK